MIQSVLSLCSTDLHTKDKISAITARPHLNVTFPLTIRPLAIISFRKFVKLKVQSFIN